MSKIKLLITGATAGIGNAIALNQLSEGAKVIATGRSQNRLSQLEKKASNLPGELKTIATNLSKPESYKQLINILDDDKKPLTGIVHCAFGHIGEENGQSIIDLEDNEIETFLDDSLKSTFLLAKYLGPILKESKGRLIFINADWGLPQHNLLLSGSSQEGPIGSEVYTAAKYAITGFASSIERLSGILVSSIYPGPVASWAEDDEFGEPKFLMPDSSTSEINQAGYNPPHDTIPLSDIVNAVSFILSTESTVKTIVLKPKKLDYIGL